MTLKTAEIQTAGGLQGGALLNEDQMLEVIKRYKPVLSLSLHINNILKSSESSEVISIGNSYIRYIHK
jgi:hypothetical protein